MSSIDRRRFLSLAGGATALLAARSAFASPATRLLRGSVLGTTPAHPPPGARISNRLTSRYGLTHPFVGAGMAFVATAPLAAAVSNAGGLGVIGCGPETPERLGLLIQDARSRTSGPLGVDLIVANGGAGPFTTELHLDVCIQHQVEVVVFFWDLPPQAWVSRLQAAGTAVWIQVGSPAEALAAQALGVDAIICQGSGAGGHNRGTMQTIPLVQGVRTAVGSSMVLLAAGGIATGRDMATALRAGADGVWVGTRLVASVEAYAHDGYKQRIVQATGPNDTVRTTLFGPEWQGPQTRVLRNRVVNQWAGQEDLVPFPPPPPAVIGTTLFRGLPYTRPKFSVVVPTPDTVGDLEEMALLAGDGVGRITSIKPAGEIVAEMMWEAEAHM
jgi:enoyl-[acyl-carrier protein] reductase II